MCCEGWRAVSLIEKERWGKVRRGANQRRRDSLEIPKSLPKCDHCIFYQARGIANGFFGPPCIKSLRAFYRPVAAGVTPADLDFLSFFATQRAFQRGLKSSDSVRSFVIYFPVKNTLKLQVLRISNPTNNSRLYNHRHIKSAIAHRILHIRKRFYYIIVNHF